MDWGSLAGLAFGLSAIILGQTLEGGSIESILQPASLIIVLGGTLSAVLLQNGIPNLLAGVRMLKRAFKPYDDFYNELTRSIHSWNSTARLEGMLKLDNLISDYPDPFIAKGLRLVVDGVEVQKMREILEIDINSYEREQYRAIKVWDAAGGYAPTMGILGAVLGLSNVMENISSPDLLGQGIATAFVSTIYGVGLANLIFLPIANKLKQHLQLEILKREMLADAFTSIRQGEHPKLIQERLSSYRQSGAEHDA
ncbi:MAG: flagellar motor protein [Methylococcaceae bacterium]|nr:flagellar motor protein [Methylococcaceae bacterium]